MNVTFKQLIIIFILFFSVGNSSAQSTFKWGKRGGSMGTGSGANADERVVDMATDQHGNVYVLSINNPGLAQVDGHNGISARDQVTFASWDCNGTFRWMKNVGSAGPVTGTALGVDTLGGVYVSGFLIGDNSLQYCYFNDSTLASTHKTMFVVKYDTSGTLKWLRMPQPDTVAVGSTSYIPDMNVCPNGDVYLYCFLTPGAYQNGALNVTSTGFYVLKYNGSGVFQNSVKLEMQTTGGSNAGNGEYNGENVKFIRNPNNGRFVISGGFNSYFGTLTIGSTPIGASSPIPLMYCASFDSLGHFIWVKQGNSGLYSEFHGRAGCNSNGNLFLGGFAEPGTVFNGQTFSNSLGANMVPFILSLDGNSGNTVWMTNPSTNAGADGGAVILNNNNVYLAGIYQHDLQWNNFSLSTISSGVSSFQIYLAKLNASTGTVMSLDSLIGTQAYNFVSSITQDNKNNLYLGGGFAYQLFVGPNTLQSVGGTHDWFVAKYGMNNCSCTLPVSSFNSGTPSVNHTVAFTYTGTASVDSVVWDYGDGTYGTGNNVSHTYANNGTYTVCATAYNGCGNNVNCKTVNIGGTAINTIKGFEQVSIYPNPAKQQLVIDHITSGTRLEIYTALGKKVKQQNLSTPQALIDVADLASGIYILRLIDVDGHIGTSKFVKE